MDVAGFLMMAHMTPAGELARLEVTVSEPITVPSLDEIAARIEACTRELRRLKKLQRLAIAATRAEESAKAREEIEAKDTP